jgi:hypothetical protein
MWALFASVTTDLVNQGNRKFFDGEEEPIKGCALRIGRHADFDTPGAVRGDSQMNVEVRPKPLNILIVDDDDGDRKQIKRVISPAQPSWVCTEAGNNQ